MQTTTHSDAPPEGLDRQFVAAPRDVPSWKAMPKRKAGRNAAAEAMEPFNLDLLVKLVYWPVVLVVVVVIGGYVVTRIRNTYAEGSQSSVDWLVNLRELHAQGTVSDDEYRTIKTNLTAKLRGELKDADKRG
jgi:hypothetical protein